MGRSGTSNGGVLSRRGAMALGLLCLTGCSVQDPTLDQGRDLAGESKADPAPAPSGGGSRTPSPPASPTASPAADAAHPVEVQAQLSGVEPSTWGLNVSGEMVRLPTRDVALTFDACGGPTGSGVDEALLEILREHRVPATLFLNQRWIQRHPRLSAELAEDPLFLLASHGARHVPLSVTGRGSYGIPGTADIAEVIEEITATDAWFERHTGAPPKHMRPGTAYCDDVSVRAAQSLGRTIAGFTVNGDGGATLSADQVARTLAAVQPGDIVLAHMNQPTSGTAEGLRQALPMALDRGIEFIVLP